jgi:hypothetical protein
MIWQRLRCAWKIDDDATCLRNSDVRQNSFQSPPHSRTVHTRGPYFIISNLRKGACGDAVGWGTALLDGKPRVRFPMASVAFFYWQSFRPHYGSGVDSACDWNEYQEHFMTGKGGRCVVLTTLPTSCAECLEIWDLQPHGTLKVCPGVALPLFSICGRNMWFMWAG